jgi:fibronectin type 3 domain-containing protein
VSIAGYEIMDMAGFFKNKDTVAVSKFSSTERIHKINTLEGTKAGVEKVTLAWDIVPEATSYNVYWGNSKGFSMRDDNKISTVQNSATIAGLKRGSTYYFVVTAVNESGESGESEELSYFVE